MNHLLFNCWTKNRAFWRSCLLKWRENMWVFHFFKFNRIWIRWTSWCIWSRLWSDVASVCPCRRTCGSKLYLRKTKLSRTLVNSLPRLELYEAGPHSMLLKTIKHVSVTKQKCKRVDMFYSIASILVCSSKLMKNRLCFWNTRQRITQIVASCQKQIHPALCASRNVTQSG
jgi:hypothetical protein